MKRFWLSFIWLTLLVALIACAAPVARPSVDSYAMPAPAAPPPAPSGEGAVQARTQDAVTNKSNAASGERMIVYTVRLSLQVQDADKAANDIAALAAQFKGYVSATNFTRDGKGRMRGSLTLRIPAESLDAAQKQIEATGIKVLSRAKSSNDVTDQYSDLGAQLKNAQATENELRELLKTVRERSNKAEDILAVYNRLTEVQGTIERIKGQMNVLEKTTALATLTVELVPYDEVQIVEPETWMPSRTAAEALRALVQALQGLAQLVIWLALFFLPIAIILLIPFVVLALLLRAWARRRAKTKTPPST